MPEYTRAMVSTNTWIASFMIGLVVCPLSPLLVYIWRTLWREQVLVRRLNIRLNEIWRREHEEAKPDDIFAAVSSEARSTRRLRTATTEHQFPNTHYMLPRFSFETLPTLRQPPILFSQYPRRSTSRSALDTAEPERSYRAP